tara:strand:+ start:6877 stop:7869 length:993 start_codon:yes stop_codon:yes gene_type:complete
MPVLNIAFVGSEDLARSLAKSNDVRDIESYVYKEERNGQVSILSLLRPLRHPERLRPLLSVLNVAKVGVVEVKAVDASLGEILVAFGASGIKRGIAIINPEMGEWIDSDQVKMILQQAGLGSWKVHESLPDAHNLREELYSHMQVTDEENSNQNLVLPVDQHFNVKGVGLVAIGYVQSGSINKHDNVLILPANENGVVRSLQVMDDDVDVAVAGDRVGVALRNLREGALNRGCMICHPESDALVRHDKSKLKLKKAPFQKRNVSIDDVVHAAVDLQFVVGRVTSLEDENITVKWDSPLWIRKDSSPSIIISQLDAMPMRILGNVDEIILD